MSSEVERRVAGAFQALAETVEQIEDQPLATGRPGRGWRLPAVTAAAVALVVAGGALLWVDQPGPQPPAWPVAVPATLTTPSPPLGQVAYDMYTHCGVDEAKVGDVFFEAETPIPGPPQDWGNPYQPGVITLLSASEAVFRDDLGHEVKLRTRPGATEFKRICQ